MTDSSVPRSALRDYYACEHVPNSNFIPGFDVLEISCTSPEDVERAAQSLEALAAQLRAAKRTERAAAYARYLDSPQWAAKRNAALARADYACQVCNAKDVQLDVHHRTYVRLGREEQYDLTVLCHACHKKFHDRLVT